jgi:hypothetical protein
VCQGLILLKILTFKAFWNTYVFYQIHVPLVSLSIPCFKR